MNWFSLFCGVGRTSRVIPINTQWVEESAAFYSPSTSGLRRAKPRFGSNSDRWDFVGVATESSQIRTGVMLDEFVTINWLHEIPAGSGDHRGSGKSFGIDYPAKITVTGSTIPSTLARGLRFISIQIDSAKSNRRAGYREFVHYTLFHELLL